MTTEKLNDLDEKFQMIFQECLDNPPIDMDECQCCLEEGQNPDDHDCPYAGLWRMPEEIEAFEGAVCWLHREEELSEEETAEFVNTLGKTTLNFFNFDIHYKAQGGGFVVSWDEMPAVVLPPLSPEYSRVSVSEQRCSPKGITSLL